MKSEAGSSETIPLEGGLVVPDEQPQPRMTARAVVREFAVYPLLVAGGCVLAFGLVRWMTHDPRTTEDLLSAVRNAGGRERWQAAHEFARRVAGAPDLLSDPELGRRTVSLFAAVEADDPQVAGYLARVLGLMAPEGGREALVEALRSGDESLRIQAALALTKMGAEDVIPAMEPLLGDKDGGVRKATAYAVGQLGGDQAVSLLVPLLRDREDDVRWNAAIALATLGCDAGLHELQVMLDRGHLQEVSTQKQARGGLAMNSGQVSVVMINAIRAVARLDFRASSPEGGMGVREALGRLRDEDESPRVQEAARLALGRMDKGLE